MTTAHNSRTASRGNAGFSMIDVLVAITVLTVGLLALGVLQAALTRNAADSRARSQLAAFTEGLIEQARSGGYDGIGSGTVLPKPGGTVAEQAADKAQTAAAVSNLKTVQTVTTYYANAAGSFSTTVPAGVSATTPQYKKMDVVTTWTDASGTPRTLTLNTIVSDVTIKDDKSPFHQQLAGPTNSAQFPVVRQDTPNGPGVIPIAVGNGNDTAATNPKPEISGTKNGKGSVIAGTTSYNVLTYQDSGALAEIQKRVETLVVSCKCQYGKNLPLTNVLAQPYRPTYWNGTRYVAPQPTKSDLFKESTEAAPPAAGEDPSITVPQSPYCTECCRDHHDRDPPAKVKFDPFRTGVGKYNYDATNKLVPASEASGDKYVNACRLIRVDGIFHTATDLHNSHFGLLPTESAAKSPVPDGDYTKDYQDFVKKYLDASYVKTESPAVSSEDADIMYLPYTQRWPTASGIDVADSARRYLHTRGLYVDYLEAPAISAIARKCQDSVTSKCVLPMLPFTTINTTELANWGKGVVDAPDNIQALQVFDPGVCKHPATPTSGTDFPLRGCAQGVATGVAYATAEMGRSNSGVAIARPVDLNDAADRETSGTKQKFNVSLSGSGTGAGDTITVMWTGLNLAYYAAGLYPGVTWKTGSSRVCDNSYSTKEHPDPNPYTCYSTPPLTNTTIVVGGAGQNGYNTTVPGKNDTVLNCGTKDVLRYCPKYAIDPSTIRVVGSTQTVMPSVVITNSNTVNEGTELTFASLAPNDKISFDFKLVSNPLAPYSCPADPAHPNKPPTVIWGSCP